MSKPYRAVVLDNGKAIRYEIKNVFGAHFLLINTNFKPLDFPDLVQVAWLAIDGMHQMDSTGIYPDGTGYVIYTLQKSSHKEYVLNEVERTFKNYTFTLKTL